MKVYNTLSGQKEEFVPAGDEVKMYVCGVTPYDHCHIGHAMSYIIFDVIRRYLEFKGYSVKHVQNFTDVDDKIIARAHELSIPPRELAEKFIAHYFDDMDAIGVKRAHLYPRATEEIPKIIEVIQGLVANGSAYQADGDVYFRVRSKPDYGKLSHRTPDGMISRARVEVDGAKEQPLDFALWKAAKPGEPRWQSPWGWGRPGWHIECSAMSLKYLGQSLDIHGGGQDLIFPHHENEIAQSESFTGVIPFARYWLHNGLLKLGEDKMSKSKGNLVTVKEVLSHHSADALRLFVLSSHYRSPITYLGESLAAMERGVERLRHSARAESEGSTGAAVDAKPYRQRFIEAMDDDFNTAQAIAALFDLSREINRGQEEGQEIGPGREIFLELAGILGLTLSEEGIHLDTEPFLKLAREHGLILKGEVCPVSSCIELLVNKRSVLRAAQKWQLADDLRSRLSELGITLEDTPKGAVWRFKRTEVKP